MPDRRIVIAALISLILAPALSFAQSTDEAEIENAQQLIKEIAAERGDTQQRLDTINKDLEVIIENEENANKTFDEMIASERAKAELGKPDGKFVQNIKKLAETARTRAGRASALGLTEIAARFQQNAEYFDGAALQAEQYHSSLQLRLDAIEAERERIIFLIQLNEQEAAKLVIAEGLKIMSESDGRLEQIENALVQADDGGSD